MGSFSAEFEINLMDTVNKLADKKMELEKQLMNVTELIPDKTVLDELGISNTTLNNWIRDGLKVYRPPYENSKKRYFRRPDLINFLTVR